MLSLNNSKNKINAGRRDTIGDEGLAHAPEDLKMTELGRP